MYKAFVISERIRYTHLKLEAYNFADYAVAKDYINIKKRN